MFAFRFSPYAWLLLGNSVAAGVIAYLAYRRRAKRTARLLFWLALAVAWWSFANGLYVAGDNFATQYFFSRIKYFGTMFVPPLWFLLAYDHTRFPKALSRGRQVGVVASTVVFLPLVLVDPKWHTWWPHQSTSRLPNGLLVTHATHSIFYTLYVAIGFFWVLAGLWLYVRHYADFPAQRPQLRWLILAALFPWVGNLVTQIGLSPLPWGLDPFLFTLSLAFLAVAILREHFLDTLPIAHRLIIRQLPQGIIVVDAARRVVDINPAALALCPHATTRPKGKPLETVLSDETLRKQLLFALYQGNDTTLEIALPAQERTLNVRVAAIRAQGEELGQIITLEDITHRKRLEEELAKARDMAIVASALKSRLLASATRDMRRPAGMLMGYLESLLQGTYGPLSTAQKQVLAQALEQGNQMLGFLNNLMDYAEIESGALMLQEVPFAPADLLENVRPWVDAVAAAKGLKTHWEIDPALPATLQGDAAWLGRVLTNLLNNAVTYTSRGSIYTRLYRLDEEHWALEVQDTGTGISPQRQKHLFDLRHAGGLGLIVARGVVERMGGQLKFSSKVGEGSTFTVVLPFEKSAAMV